MSGWNGGWGDALDVEEALQRLEPFIGVVEAERHRDGVDRQDVMQEARIAAWKAHAKQPEDQRTYLLAAVKQRTNGVVVRQDWTGRPSRQGKQDPDALTMADALDEGLALVAADLISSLDLAYHHGEVLEALQSLRPHEREYVYLRFWLGMSEAEIAAEKGTTKARENALWNRSIRPALATALAHLA